MNKYVTSLFATLLLCINTVNAEQSGADHAVLKFFDASRNGNSAQMLELISGSYYNRRKAVLENDGSYPEFLVDHYKGTTTMIEKSEIDEKNQVAVVIVTTRFPDQSLNTSRLLLKKDENDAWKIVDEK